MGDRTLLPTGPDPSVGPGPARRIGRVHSRCWSTAPVSPSGTRRSWPWPAGPMRVGRTPTRVGKGPTAPNSRWMDDRSSARNRQAVRPNDRWRSPTAGTPPTTTSSHPWTMRTPPGAMSLRPSPRSTASAHSRTMTPHSFGACPSRTRAVATPCSCRRRPWRPGPHPGCRRPWRPWCHPIGWGPLRSSVTPLTRWRSCEGIPHRTACHSLPIPLDRPSLPRSAATDLHVTQSNEGHPIGVALIERMSGSVLLSHKVPLAVPSALRGLASGFGMGPGVSLSL